MTAFRESLAHSPHAVTNTLPPVEHGIDKDQRMEQKALAGLVARETSSRMLPDQICVVLRACRTVNEC